jgi:hypothetical protein
MASIAKGKIQALVSELWSQSSIIVFLLGFTQFLPCFLLLAIDMSQNLSMSQDDHYRCRTYRYKDLVASVVIWLVSVSVDL